MVNLFAWKNHNHSDLLQAYPGMSMEYAGTTAPVGWLLQDGSAVSRTTYANLFAAIGTIHGAGDGVTTFNLPDHRGRVGIGVGTATGAAGATAHTLGQKGGEETHALTAAENGPHAHNVPNEDGQPPRRSAGGGAGAIPGVTFASYTDLTPATTTSGSGSPHNNLPPYIGMNYIIKT